MRKMEGEDEDKRRSTLVTVSRLVIGKREFDTFALNDDTGIDSSDLSYAK